MANTSTDRPSIRRNRDLWLLLSGQAVSLVGVQAQFLALPLIVLSVSGSPSQASIVTGLGTNSFLFFGLISGALADRWNRKAVMVWCEAGRAALVGSVALALLTGHLGLAQLYLVSVLSGVLSTLFQAASSAALPNIVTPAQLPTALGYMATAQNTIRVFGAVAAGALYSVSRIVPFALNAIAYALSAVSLGLIRSEFQEEREQGPANLLREMGEGVLWTWRQKVVRTLTLVSAGDSLRYGAGYLVIIVLAQEAGASTVMIGVIFSGAAVGALIGAVLASRAVQRFPLGRIVVVMLWVEAVGFTLYAVAPNAGWLTAITALESLVAPVYGVAISTYRAAITPDELRGRVSSADFTLNTGAMSLGTLASGFLISTLGAKRLVVVLSAWMVFLAVVTTVHRSVRTAPIASMAESSGTARTTVGTA
ncbi:MFS transporter [Streptomyces sp. NPDC050610]|uniref:MFS transporter n=1 Tax=Streptomyces sp. NPDC050610 TaxID=3157097 RepID=UPI00343E37E5